ncbi:uncharacterized protein LOC120772140 isoform X2 [Bactrocera tryoni]|uniref:uncharacterized protein LOC120772140 isoform X2 n=1 Tax=Bactrocera tryoni TaxID=59916 RepID=UPI001A95DE70|nr:uncharacterized protein LOC120772140 isoform X2 [Bactrocera tryoni]
MLPANLLNSFYWSRMFNVLMQNYLLSTTTCIIWPENADFAISWQRAKPPDAAIINIRLRDLEQSFSKDVVDFAAKREELLNDYVVLNPFVEKLTLSIEKSHCQNFIAFQMDIPIFIDAVINASRFSIWRSSNNKFVFVYNKGDLLDEHFEHRFFEDQSGILLIERTVTDPAIFDLKTNKFVGPRAENPKQLYLLDRFNAESNTFLHGNDLFPDKLSNLQGREVILAAFDYRPDVVLKYYPGAPSRDRAFAPNGTSGDVEMDGTEVRILKAFCEKHNCSVDIDTYHARPIIIALSERMRASEDKQNSWARNFEYAFSTTMLLFVSQSNKGTMVNFTPLRLMLFASFLNDIVITSIYGGGLSSILTVPSFGQAADSVERLYAFQLKWGADSEAWVAAIRDDESEIMKGLLRNFAVYSAEELMVLAQTEEMGFTIERLPFGHFAVQDHLTLSVLNKMKIMVEDIYFQYTVAFTARMWPLLESFNEMVVMWHSSGLDKIWEWRIVADNLDGAIQKELMASQYTNLDDIGPVKLGMSNFVGMLLLWLLGITCAFLAFLAELLLDHMKRAKKVAESDVIEIREGSL